MLITTSTRSCNSSKIRSNFCNGRKSRLYHGGDSVPMLECAGVGEVGEEMGAIAAHRGHMRST